MLNTIHYELRRWWRRMTTSVWRMPKHVRWRWSSFIIHSHIWTKKKTLLSFKTLLIIKWSRMLKNFYPMMLCWFIWTRKSNSECKINFLQHTHKKKTSTSTYHAIIYKYFEAHNWKPARSRLWYSQKIPGMKHFLEKWWHIHKELSFWHIFKWSFIQRTSRLEHSKCYSHFLCKTILLLHLGQFYAPSVEATFIKQSL